MDNDINVIHFVIKMLFQLLLEFLIYVNFYSSFKIEILPLKVYGYINFDSHYLM